ncbi:MAG TPA: glycoside hydrolase family 31 protein, partial [Candidatus Kryptobacter bacterium]|nr:glycoside hydrolase family 31 protein [Candidatus Kryptobacter bacterium]
GFPDWGSDVGGYLGNAGMEPEDLFSRWLQFGAWSGVFEIKLDGAGGSGEDRAPWHYSDTLQDNFRRACEERMELAPYVYSQLNTSDVNGVLMKPLAYEYPGDSNTYSIWNEYLFGNSFLVAPVTEPGQPTRHIYLPVGVWYDWYSPSRSYAGGKTYTCVLSEKHIPVFVKQNAIFVTGENWLTGNSVKWNGETKPSLIINAFPGDSDLTNSFTYVDRFAADSLKKISISQKGNRINISVPALGCEGKVIVYNVVPKGSVRMNGTKVRARVDKERRTVEVEIEKGVENEMVIAR